METTLTEEKSNEMAKTVKEIAELARTLDIEYLTECLTKMKDAHSFRESAMILSPNPHTIIESQKLNLEKIEAIKLILELAKNQNAIYNATFNLIKAERNSNRAASIFGF